MQENKGKENKTSTEVENSMNYINNVTAVRVRCYHKRLHYKTDIDMKPSKV